MGQRQWETVGFKKVLVVVILLNEYQFPPISASVVPHSAVALAATKLAGHPSYTTNLMTRFHISHLSLAKIKPYLVDTL